MDMDFKLSEYLAFYWLRTKINSVHTAFIDASMSTVTEDFEFSNSM